MLWAGHYRAIALVLGLPFRSEGNDVLFDVTFRREEVVFLVPVERSAQTLKDNNRRLAKNYFKNKLTFIRTLTAVVYTENVKGYLCFSPELSRCIDIDHCGTIPVNH
jgi:hypothetical protein